MHLTMNVKLTFLWKQNEETMDIEKISKYIERDIVPKCQEIPGVSHVEVCQFVPFSFLGEEPSDEINPEKVVVQMDLYYQGGSAGLERAMANFNDAYLVQEIIRQDSYLDVYVSYVSTHKKQKSIKNLFKF